MSRKAKMRKSSARSKKGAMMNMRTGIKKAAESAGVGEEHRRPTSWLNHTITAVLLIVLIYVVYTRFIA